MKKITPQLFLILCLSLTTSMVTQAAAPTATDIPATTTNFDGKYEGSFTGELRGKTYSKPVTLNIKDASGTWRTSALSNPCLNFEIKFNNATITTDTISFVTEYSKMLSGCRDLKVTLTRSESGLLVGTLDVDGLLRPLNLKKVSE